MSTAAENPPTEPAPRRRWLRRVVAGVGLLLGLLLLAYATRDAVVHGWLVERAQTEVRERWGAELTIAEFECDWFRHARLGGVTLHADAPVPELGGLVSATLDELEVEFSLLELWRGEWPARLRGSGLRATLDPRVANLERAPDDAEEQVARRWPAIDFVGIELTALLDGEHAVLRGGAIALEPHDWDDRDALLHGLRGELELVLGQQTLALAGLELDGEPRVTLHAALSAGELTLDTAQADWAGTRLTLERGTVGLAPLAVDLDFSVAAPDLAAVGPALGDASWAGAVHGGVHVAGTWPELALSATLEGDAVLAADHPIGDVELGLQLALRGLALRTATGALELRAGPLLAGQSRIEELTATVQLLPESLRVVEATVRQPGNRLEFEDLELPRSSEPDVWLARSSGQFRMQLTDLARALGQVTALGMPPHELILAGELGDGRARIESGTLTTSGGNLVIHSGVLSLAEGDEFETEFEATVAFDDLAPLGAILGDPTWAGEVHGALQASGRLPEVIAEVQLIGSGVRIFGVPLGEFEADGRLDREAFRARSIAIHSGTDELTLSGGVRFDGPTFEDLHLQGRVADAGRYVPEFALASGAAAVEIDLVLDGPPTNLEGRVDLTMQGWSALGLEVADVEFAARAANGRYDIEHLAAVVNEGRLELAGFVEPPVAASGAPDSGTWSITASTGSFAGEQLDVQLTRPAEFSVAQDGTPRSGTLALAGTPGQLELSFDRTATGLTASAQGDLTPPRVLLDRYLTGGPRWERVAGALLLADGQLTLDGFELEGAEWRLEAQGSAPLDPLGADLFPAGLVALGAELTHANLAQLIASDDPLDAESDLPISGGGEAVLTLGGSWLALEGVLDLTTDELIVHPTDQRARIAAHALLEPGQLRLERAALEVPGRLALGINGALTSATTPHAWLADPAGELARSALDLRGEFDLQDLSWLAALSPALRRTGGAARGELVLAGPLAAPQLAGRAVLTDGELKLTSEVPAMSALELELEFAERTVTLARAEGELGGSPFALEGTILMGSSAAPTALDLHLVGQNLLIHRDRDVLLRADADLELHGELAALTASGRLDLRQPKYTKDIDLLNFSSGEGGPTSGERGFHLFSLTEAPLADLRFDIRIETVEPLLLRNNILRGGLRPSLHLGGTGRIPRLLGTIYLDPTRIKLPASTVTLNSGTITFLASDPFVPELEIFGSAVKFGHEITLLVTGPYDAPETTLTSSPPLAKEDLLLILLTGQFPNQAATIDGTKAATQTVALYLAEDLVTGWMSDGSIEDGQDSFFDGVEFIMGREITNSGIPTTEVYLKLADNLATERDHLKLAMERDVWEDYNLGVRFVLILR